MTKIRITDAGDRRDIKKTSEKGLDRYPEKTSYREVSQSERIEAILQKKRDAHDRVLNTPRLEGFEKLGEKEQKEIKDFVAKEHPDKHLNDINMSKITYHDNPKIGEKGDLVLGKWKAEKREGIKTQHGTIDVYPQGLENKDLHGVKETLSHEVGHDVFFRMDSEKQNKWEKISGKREGADCVSPYSTKDMHEDFAESYSFYINHANELKNINEDKYEFMKDEVFDQRTYRT